MPDDTVLIAAIGALVAIFQGFIAWQNGRIHKVVNSAKTKADETIVTLQATTSTLTATNEALVAANVQLRELLLASGPATAPTATDVFSGAGDKDKDPIALIVSPEKQKE